MSEQQELTGIERELVIQYLRDDNVPLTVTLEEKPSMAEVDFDQEKTQLPDEEKRIPASAVFPVAIKADQISVLNQGIILLKNQARTVQPFLGKQVRVQFYFNHLGLYFITEMKECSKGLALVVPAKIYRIPDVTPKVDYDFTGELCYEVENSIVKIDCLPLAGYKIFTQPKWGDIPDQNQIEAKSLLERFVNEVKSGEASPVGNGLQLLTIVKYLCERKKYESPEAVQGRIKPFNMIYVDDKRIVLAAGEGTEELSDSFDYNIILSFSISGNKIFKRRVSIECSVENSYINANNPHVKCYSLKYKGLKEEDYRFIYERITGRFFDLAS
ncbi:MAG: hypothetical protein K6B17_10560 [Treponema sp.]|nr:hypothetical protein [Treponema sp.]